VNYYRAKGRRSQCDNRNRPCIQHAFNDSLSVEPLVQLAAWSVGPEAYEVAAAAAERVPSSTAMTERRAASMPAGIAEEVLAVGKTTAVRWMVAC